jgi:hypothetical protein
MEILSPEQQILVETAINNYFYPLKQRLSVLQEFIRNQQHPHEEVLLLCSYLDALATSVFGKVMSPSEDRLGLFLREYSSYGARWSHISIPDLFEYLSYGSNYYACFCSQLAPTSPVEVEFRKCLKNLGFVFDWSGSDNLDQLLDDLLLKLSSLGKVTPRRGDGHSIFEETSIYTMLGSRLGDIFTPLVKKFQISSILYRNFRCQSVHQLHIPEWLIENDRFFSEDEPFHVSYIDKADGEEYLALTFTAGFLLKTLDECISGVQNKLASTRIIPVEIWFDVFWGEECGDLVEIDHSTI